tara:strand:- start:243 stop:575 length:333 start_codon:yes stop_codon:yes gene_type:complete
MSRDITEQIDDHCEDYFGHKDWVIISTLSDQEKVGLDSVADIETFEGVQVAFYHKERPCIDKSVERIDSIILDYIVDYEETDDMQEIIIAWKHIQEELYKPYNRKEVSNE